MAAVLQPGGSVGDERRSEGGGLILLVDHDVASRRHSRHLLELHGLDVVQASNGIAALELIQRLPESFRLVITEFDLPGLSGAAVTETLRLFRPDLRTVCLSSRSELVSGGRCLPKPLEGAHLRAIMEGAFADGDGHGALPERYLVRARARFAQGGDLVEAALELARGLGPAN